MKKVGIVSIWDISNYGNRLQSYAVYNYFKNIGYESYVLVPDINPKNKLIKAYIKYALYTLGNKSKLKKKEKRTIEFLKFTVKNIKHSNIKYKCANEIFDYVIIGSDQVWNPDFAAQDFYFLNFVDKNKKICFSPSFGVSSLPIKDIDKFRQGLSTFNYISVREEMGKKIIQDILKKDVEVLIDPTMMLDIEEWRKVSQKVSINTKKPYILKYFLKASGYIDESEKEIEKIAKENNMIIYTIPGEQNNVGKDGDEFCLDQIGPSEFIYLIENASLICTNSYHAAVFSILYKKPFIVFDRKDGHLSMNSRIDTLLKTFELEERKYDLIKNKNIFDIDYLRTFKILKGERMRVTKFLQKSLEQSDLKKL